MNPDEFDFYFPKPAYTIAELLNGKLPYGRNTLYNEVRKGNIILTKVGKRSIVRTPNRRRYFAYLQDKSNNNKEIKAHSHAKS